MAWPCNQAGLLPGSFGATWSASSFMWLPESGMPSHPPFLEIKLDSGGPLFPFSRPPFPIHFQVGVERQTWNSAHQEFQGLISALGFAMFHRFVPLLVEREKMLLSMGLASLSALKVMRRGRESRVKRLPSRCEPVSFENKTHSSSAELSSAEADDGASLSSCA